jgi:hypothetical protein
MSTRRERAAELLPKKTHRKTRIGLVAGGLGAYWPQFPELLPQLEESARYVTQRFQALDAEVIDVGFISDPPEAAVASEKLRQAGSGPDRHLPYDLPHRINGPADCAALRSAGVDHRPSAHRSHGPRQF